MIPEPNEITFRIKDYNADYSTYSHCTLWYLIKRFMLVSFRFDQIKNNILFKSWFGKYYYSIKISSYILIIIE